MFPFGNSSNGNPILHSSVPYFHSSNSSFLGLNGNQILLHQHLDHQFSTDHHYLDPNADLIENSSSSVMFANNVISSNMSKSQDFCDTLNKMKKKKPVKKDQHSKILTSQGHRDRRVRLSIGIARKFFDLQDMLGFNKPSKTLDWLFTKSKLAIDELIGENANKIKSSTPSSINSECEDIVPAANELTKRGKQVKKEEAIVLKESRAKARTRARERTIKKIWSQIEAKSNTSLVKEQTKMEEIKVIIHPNIKSSPTSLGFHPILNGPKEACCCSSTRYWDHNYVNGTIMSSSLCAPTISTSSQVQKAWDSYHGSQI